MPPNLMPRRESPQRARAVADDQPPPDLFELSAIERGSSVWQKLKVELTKRLEAKRAENDSPLSAEDTARARGHIECLRMVLAIGEGPPTFEE